METLFYWVLATLAVTVVAVLGWLRRAKRSQPDTVHVSMTVASQFLSLPGVNVADHYVSRDLSCAIGFDSDSQSLLLWIADTHEIKRFRTQDIDEVEIVEDGETVAKTTRSRRPDDRMVATRWQANKPRIFSTVRTLVLRLVVNDNRRVYLVDLLGTDTGVDRADQAFQDALQAGERWYGRISDLMENVELPAAPGADALAATYASRGALKRELTEYLRRERALENEAEADSPPQPSPPVGE